MSLLHVVFHHACATVAVLLVLAAAVTIRPGALGLPGFLADGRYHLGLLAILGCMLSIWSRSWRSAAALATVAALNLSPVATLNLGSRSAPAGPSFGVTLINLWYGNAAVDEVFEYLEAEAPDVVGLLEVSPTFYNAVEERLAERFPYRSIQAVDLPGVFARPFGMGLLSRFPIRDVQVVRPCENALPYVKVVVDMPGGAIDVFVVHAMPPPRFARVRDEFLREVAQAVDPRRPSVVMGDLNATGTSEAFAALLSGADLADSRRGFGRQPTWSPPWIPVWLGLPLDHVLVTKHFVVQNRSVGPAIGSDHRPVTVRMGWVPD